MQAQHRRRTSISGTSSDRGSEAPQVSSPTLHSYAVLYTAYTVLSCATSNNIWRELVEILVIILSVSAAYLVVSRIAAQNVA